MTAATTHGQGAYSLPISAVAVACSHEIPNATALQERSRRCGGVEATVVPHPAHTHTQSSGSRAKEKSDFVFFLLFVFNI